ncbi:pentapeptide repeat-containing protein [bacterium]|nr:pentapeptide repeat-containing protein [bacterium]
MWWLYLLYAVLGIASTWLLCWLLPKWYVRSHAPGAGENERINLELQVVDLVLKILGGAVVIASLLLQSNHFLAEQRAANRREAEQAAREQRDRLEQRFNDAVGRLGSSDAGQRMAGAYALEELASQQPEEYYWKSLDLLCATLRSRSQLDRALASPSATIGGASQSGAMRQSPDIQAMLLVLGRRDRSLEESATIPTRFAVMQAYYDPDKYERQLRSRLGLPAAEPVKLPSDEQVEVRPWLDLSYTDLTGADLTMQHFEGANFEGADLSGARLNGAYLDSALLWSATMRKADLSGADLSHARFWDTDLRGADLSGARLNGATLWLARLDGANLSGADFQDADLRKAHLEGADLRGAQNLSAAELAKAFVDANTKLPDGIQRSELQSPPAAPKS